LRCLPCACAMSPAHTTKGETRYRYYTCSSAQKKGWNTCPSKSIPAAEIEELVVEQVRCVGRDQALLHDVLEQARRQYEERVAELETEQRGLQRNLTNWQGEVLKLSGQIVVGQDNGSVIGRLADLHERIGSVEERVRKVREQIKAIHEQLVDEDAAMQAL